MLRGTLTYHTLMSITDDSRESHLPCLTDVQASRNLSSSRHTMRRRPHTLRSCRLVSQIIPPQISNRSWRIMRRRLTCCGITWTKQDWSGWSKSPQSSSGVTGQNERTERVKRAKRTGRTTIWRCEAQRSAQTSTQPHCAVLTNDNDARCMMMVYLHSTDGDTMSVDAMTTLMRLCIFPATLTSFNGRF